MKLTQFLTLLAVAASASALTTEQQIQEMEILLTDVGANLNDYVGLVGQMDIPDALFDIYGEMLTATDDSYTTLLAQLDMSQISTMMTALPWYSSRLLPLVSTFNEVPAAQTTSTTAAAQTISTTAAAQTTAVANTEVAISSTSITSSSAATAAQVSSIKSVSVLFSNTTSTSGKVQDASSSTNAVYQQTENNAINRSIGLGAAVAAVAALLL
ncbi:hypothetical protein TPHA_0L00795 [Tetrapisispora phaffii CBS 4417]|uniref:Uncharacterized protein n=1 Tax=Tetrapisispora phaffii (strain ATCC 24235 / CBS 4417 / NBRC 1672 / NRRL Y-8282 / UCD 70-5) TaxID=1071381 RepID=G8BZV8_TETPH|nr:hypothetical protein TPHA_0L00795 [Tetrapisispora phaffii CBS 4417]CCE65436.1 hypothetical protein TPHA_0L00795 [Tetrapisispora phaffii CBS 4417]